MGVDKANSFHDCKTCLKYPERGPVICIQSLLLGGPADSVSFYRIRHRYSQGKFSQNIPTPRTWRVRGCRNRFSLDCQLPRNRKVVLFVTAVSLVANCMTRPMHHFRGTLIPLLALSPVMFFGQANTSTPPAAPVAPSVMLQPALSSVESTLNALKIDKWKKGSVRDEAGDNVKAILQDLKTNVPPLLADADAAPSAPANLFPL